MSDDGMSVRIRLGQGLGKIEVNGKEITNNVIAFYVDSKAGQKPVVTLVLKPDTLETVLLDATVVSEKMITSGTPPHQDANIPPLKADNVSVVKKSSDN